MRERDSAEAAVKGRRWYIRRLLGAQRFTNRLEASQWMIQHSRKLIGESRHRILASRNNAVFSRTPRRLLN